MEDNELPENVRRVPAPAVRWQIHTAGYAFDGYVFEDDPSDLARFMRWLADQPARMTVNGQFSVQKVVW